VVYVDVTDDDSAQNLWIEDRPFLLQRLDRGRFASFWGAVPRSD